MLTVTSEVATTPSVFLNLWKHECNRVIADRFTNQQDKDWFEKTLKQVIEEDFDTDTANLMDPEPYFVDFLRDAPEPTGMTSILTRIVLTVDWATQKLLLGVEFCAYVTAIRGILSHTHVALNVKYRWSVSVRKA